MRLMTQAEELASERSINDLSTNRRESRGNREIGTDVGCFVVSTRWILY